ncbi:MAG: S-layer homology domain-containing protein [Clostridia bacterium]|nr:S-layer homology domain-containing protein [Clostridia bacterium]
MIKKIITGVMCVALLLSQLTFSVFAFDDVDAERYSWATTQINEMADMGIINGFEDGSFRPDQGVTRIDSLLLISRILGVNNPTEAKIVELAENNYYPVVNLLKYPAYQKNLAYILYREVFSPEELQTFLKLDLGAQPVKRYEAAVLMVKMANAEDELLKADEISLPFADVEEISAKTLPHVNYCYQHGLMKGVEDNKFDPNGIVTRAQMSVLLYNAMKTLNLSTVCGTVEEVSGFDNSITYIDEFNNKEVFNNTGDVRITLNAENIEDIDMISTGDIINVQYSGKDIYMIEALTVLKDETIEGYYAGKGSSSTIQKILVREIGDDPSTLSYILDDDVRIYLDGEEVSMSSLQSGDRIKLTIRDSRVTIINAAARKTTINGYISAFDYEEEGSLSIKLSNNSVVTYPLSEDDVSVTRNGDEVTMRDLKVGDKVTVKMEYDIIYSVDATSVKKSYEGTIEEIIISSTNPRIKIDIGKEEIECAMDNSIAITINGEEATIYDVRLGFPAVVKTDSSTVTEVTITSTPTVESVNVMGTVTEVNTNYSSITLLLNDGSYEKVFVKSGASIINGTTGKKATLSTIKPGDTLTAVVSTTGFTAEAISIVVFPAGK